MNFLSPDRKDVSKIMGFIKKTVGEFKEFALRGNAVDLAVGVIIGAAFKAITDSLVNDVMSPAIGLLIKTDFNDLLFTVGDVNIKYGAFITSVVSFLITAVVIFILVKTLNTLSKAGRNIIGKDEQEPAPPNEKMCEFCCSKININASRCPFCTSEQSEACPPTEALNT